MFPDVSCTIADMDKRDWERLGGEVVRRRVHLGMKTREALAEATGLSSRVLSDIEKGRRTSYGPGTLLTVEKALRWLGGSVERVLNGEDPIQYEDEEIPSGGAVYLSPRDAKRLDDGEVQVRFTDLSALSKSAHKLNRALIREADGDSYRLDVADRVGEVADQASRLVRIGIAQLVDPDAWKPATQIEGEADEDSRTQGTTDDATAGGGTGVRTPTTGAAGRGNVTPLNRRNPGEDLDRKRAASDRAIETEDNTPGE